MFEILEHLLWPLENWASTVWNNIFLKIEIKIYFVWRNAHKNYIALLKFNYFPSLVILVIMIKIEIMGMCLYHLGSHLTACRSLSPYQKGGAIFFFGANLNGVGTSVTLLFARYLVN